MNTSKLTRCVSDDRRENIAIQFHHLIRQPKQEMEIKIKGIERRKIRISEGRREGILSFVNHNGGTAAKQPVLRFIYRK
ncbi:hypothetical protein OIU79_017090, partial [Salix purpurea]